MQTMAAKRFFLLYTKNCNIASGRRRQGGRRREGESERDQHYKRCQTRNYKQLTELGGQHWRHAEGGKGYGGGCGEYSGVARINISIECVSANGRVWHGGVNICMVYAHTSIQILICIGVLCLIFNCGRFVEICENPKKKKQNTNKKKKNNRNATISVISRRL